MAKFRPGLRQIARAFLIRGIAALLLLQTVALAYSEARPTPPGVMAGQICRPMSDGGGHAPARSDGPGHCLFCPTACADGDAKLVTLVATAILVLHPGDRAAPGRRIEPAANPRPDSARFRQFSRAPPAA
ncbi:MAG TPA: hypothetical protein VIF40_08390 [Methylosinus sp.]|jgi:hypothetical protein|uniref:hypothetical protein n=1 Tax=Methylosinus sp. TaxID=427 RepID=UPI002F92300B